MSGDTLAPGWELQVADLLEHAVSQLVALVPADHKAQAVDIADVAYDLLAVLPAMVKAEVAR